MIKNYFLVAFRNLVKNKLFSFINIIGLSVGIGASLLILNYLRFEKSYDQFYSKKNSIFRVPMEIVEKGGSAQTFAFTYPAVAGALKNDFEEVEESIRLRKIFSIIYVEDKVIPELKGFWADEEVFKIFDLPFIYGDEASLTDLNSAAVTKKTALKLFGEIDARGKTFKHLNQVFKVSAVLEDIPENSHLKFDFLLPYNKYVELVKVRGGDAQNNWGWSDFYTYVLLKPGINPSDLEAKLPDFAKRYKGEDMITNGYTVDFHLQPLSEIHTRSRYDYELEGNGNFEYLDYLAAAAIFILLMAWLNYVNLSTSRSLERAKEVGIRKTVGAFRIDITRQFLMDAFLVNGMAIAIGVVMLMLINPFISNIVGKQIPIPSLTSYSFWSVVFLSLGVGAFLSGFYPAFILSSINPFQALKGIVMTGTLQSKSGLRKTLVVVQVGLAVILISGTIGLLRQVQFMRNQDLGINIKQTLVLRDRINRDSTSIPVVESFITELKRNPAVVSVTASTDVPGNEIGGSSDYKKKEAVNYKRCRNFEVDENFFTDYQLMIVAGQGFAKDNDETKVVLNETAARILGFETPEEAINRVIVDGGRSFTVIGVVKDYHQESLQYEIDPTVFFKPEFGWDYYSIKVEGKDMTATIAQAEKTWKQFFPESPVDYFFLDSYYDAQYKSELTFELLLTSFTFIGILVAALGLLGLSLFTVTKRSKEIGLRKVLGASVFQVVSLVTKEYILLSSLAFIIAMPFAYWMVSRWIEGYAFRASLGLWFFLFPFFLILAITLLSVGLHALRSAWTNPVKSLRSE